VTIRVDNPTTGSSIVSEVVPARAVVVDLDTVPASTLATLHALLPEVKIVGITGSPARLLATPGGTRGASAAAAAGQTYSAPLFRCCILLRNESFRNAR